YLQAVHSLASFIPLLIDLSFVIDLYLQPGRKCIYYRSTYAMKAAGYLVSPASKLSTRMENGKYHLYCRNSCFMIDPHRDTSSVIYNCDRIILIDRHINGITKT